VSFLNFVGFIQSGILNFLNFLDNVWTWAEF